MPAEQGHDRAYFQSRLREEIDRAHRYGGAFSVLVFEVIPTTDGVPVRRKVEWAAEALAATLRASDVIARVFEDTIAVLLLDADGLATRDALLRLRNRLQGSGVWRIATYAYPRDSRAIEALPALTAA